MDDAIRRFDPTWDGSGKTETQRREKGVRVQTGVAEFIAARSALLIEGAIVLTQCEGPNSDGKYGILVGMAWGNHIAALTLSMASLAEKPLLDRSGASISEQLRNETERDPDWLAYTQGTRLWFNESGDPVIIGFGAAQGTSSITADQARAQLQALAAIQRFVGEQIETMATEATEFLSRDYISEQQRTFDASAFHQRIQARASILQLSGVTQVYRWRGKLPWWDAPMQVVALMWSPNSNEAARVAGTEIRQLTGTP